MTESRTFAPPASIKSNAHISSQEEYQKMWDQSINDPNGFWLEQAKSLSWYKKPTKSLEYTWDTKARKIEHTWFADGELNVSYNCLDRHLGTPIDHLHLLVASRRCRVLFAVEVDWNPELTQGGETMALAKVEPGRDFKAYSKDLVKAKDKTLPDLFRRIKSENEAMARWMGAKVIPLKAQADGMKSVVGRIEDRIFSVELYAGLTEEVELVRDGEPADMSEKVHLLQRRHYMDEECLARYETGGMEFKDIRAFDAWLSREDNFERLLPFPRCVVAFRVRRNHKEREIISLSDFVNLSGLQALDKRTFLRALEGEGSRGTACSSTSSPATAPFRNSATGWSMSIWGTTCSSLTTMRCGRSRRRRSPRRFSTTNK